MEKTLSKILLEIKPKLHTPFALFDRKGQKIFGDDLKGKVRKMEVRLCGTKYVLLADLPSTQMKDFCLLMEGFINSRFNEMLRALIQGKNLNLQLENFPFPCGLVLIKSDALAELELFLQDLFEEGFIMNIEGFLLLIFPMNSIEEIKETSQALYQTISEEISSRAVISIGGIADSREELTKVYCNAKKALIFPLLPKKGVLYYPEMVLERLLLSLPEKNRQVFIDEMGINLKKLDEETLKTIQVVLECNLNMAEAARRLYIHRNTLMYRLDKVFSLTGLDLRNFKDAVKMEIYFTLNGLF
jgi:carbohydrate diacid regulator